MKTPDTQSIIITSVPFTTSESDTRLFFTPSDRSTLTVGDKSFEISYKNKSVMLKLKNPDDILMLPKLFALFLSKYGIQSDVIEKEIE